MHPPALISVSPSLNGIPVLLRVIVYSGTAAPMSNTMLEPNQSEEPQVLADQNSHLIQRYWAEEDFEDRSTSADSKIDPWEFQPVNVVETERTLASNWQNAAKSQPNDSELDITFCDLESAQNFANFDEGSVQESPDDFELSDLDSSGELNTLHTWDEDQLDDNGTSIRPSLKGAEPDAYDHEPAALFDFRSELGEALYELDDSVPNWGRALTVDQFIAGLGDGCYEKRQQIADLLFCLSAPRLRSWLPWLRNQQWTGHTLLLFLQFRALWDRSPELWLYLHWSAAAKMWLTFWNRNSISLDATYQLIKRRINHPADEVIDLEWLEDWEDVDVWVRVDQGFFSFASFALYRSRLQYGEDWRRRPDLDVDFNSVPSSSFVRKVPWEIKSYGDWPRFTFDEMSWYDPLEWHDGFGW